jgi:hypothetical protein
MKKPALHLFLMLVALTGLVLVCVVALRYSYSRMTMVESGPGLLILLGAAAWLWFTRNWAARGGSAKGNNSAMILGIFLGLLWMIE